MAIQTFLAMTGAEIAQCSGLPQNICWMACHFSASGPGVCDLPTLLPPASMLILDDSIPIRGHDPGIAAAQVAECISRLGCQGFLLDLQRPRTGESAAFVRALTEALPCPVAVSASFAAETEGPVFLPPLPHHVPLTEHIAPWQGRELWLELALDSETITLTESGSAVALLPPGTVPSGGHQERNLHCHYRIELSDNAATFTLWRTKEDLRELLEEAESLGITTSAGLYQELA